MTFLEDILAKNTIYSADFKSLLIRDYGKDYSYLNKKITLIDQLLHHHKKEHGNENILLVRSPGRVNLMGRHIDHQGGCVNVIAIDKEIFVCASLRTDSKITASNVDQGEFKVFEFDPFEHQINFSESWDHFLKSTDLQTKLRSPKGSWINYFKAAMYRLMFEFIPKHIKGCNFSVRGNIPIAAGLSSSSALLVAIFKALLEFNNISFSKQKVLELSSEAEWFVGTRGGASDHAAILFGRKNKILHIKFFEFQIEKELEYPKDWALLICNSHITADKSGKKRSIFNERIFSYTVGLDLFKKVFPRFYDKIEFLRDINSENLNISESEILDLILEIPEYLTFSELRNELPSKLQEYERIFNIKDFKFPIPIRKVLIYGISECKRSKNFTHLLREIMANQYLNPCHKFQPIKRYMQISHDGDRKVVYDSQLYPSEFQNDFNDETIKSYIQENKPLEMIPGGYECSLPELDFIVDIVANNKHVYAAQLSGGGLGGCDMVIADKRYKESIAKEISELYEKKFLKKCTIYSLKPVNGLSVYFK
ncbi:MAG: putative Galactokinase [Promethearchaeota archaeon]|nr:MAG: putative Galactokinase [Candidatus Lokiarchaeota archaeon]